MSPPPDDGSRSPDETPLRPMAPPLHQALVYECSDPEQAAALLTGERAGYVYRRSGHPNADLLAEACRKLHGAERAAICGSGMSALSAAALALLKQGDHVVVSHQVYGKTLDLLTAETARLGITSTVVNTCDLEATKAALGPQTRLLVTETISNPLLRVADIAALAEAAHGAGALLLVDNTFASPALCRPLEFGADIVQESMSKIMNGHSDVLLGLLCGRAEQWERIPGVITNWGLAAAPFECWLAHRGLGTLDVRVDRACANAMHVAEHLQQQGVEGVHYPGLPDHPDHELAGRQLANRFGTIVSFTLPGGLDAAKAFMAAAGIPFSPSLADLCTTLSHPLSTSHLNQPAERLAALGISGGTIRLSLGIEPAEQIVAALDQGLGAVR